MGEMKRANARRDENVASPSPRLNSVVAESVALARLILDRVLR